MDDTVGITIGVFGATGRVGREVVRLLVEANQTVRAFTRNPMRADLPAGVEVVGCDLGEPETLAAKLAGIERLFLLTTGPQALDHDRNVAAVPGIRRVVKLSSVAAMPPTGNVYAAAHAEGEYVVQVACPEWTMLRPAAFMSNMEYWLPPIEAERTVHASFGSIPRAVVDPRDVAAVAVRALVEDSHIGETYTITGPEALTVPEQVDRLSRVANTPLEYVDVPGSAARAGMIGGGMPPELVDGLVAELADPDPRRGGIPLPTVERVTGRHRPRSTTG